MRTSEAIVPEKLSPLLSGGAVQRLHDADGQWCGSRKGGSRVRGAGGGGGALAGPVVQGCRLRRSMGTAGGGGGLFSATG